MLTLVMALAFQNSVTFAKSANENRPLKRVYITPTERTVEDALEPFKKPPSKCVPHPSKPMTERQKFLAQATAQKSPEEVEHYLRCYPGANYQSYVVNNGYRDMIETAAREFQVDQSLMKCLLRRESQWKSSTVSCTCAMGLGQQTGGNLESMKDTIASTLSGQAWTNYMNQMRAKDPNFSVNCSGDFRRSHDVVDKEGKPIVNDPFYKSVMAHQEKGCKPLKEPCHVFRQDDRRCPAASIGATAAFLKYVQSIVRKAVNCGQIEPWQIPDSNIAIALAYNAGGGTFQKAIKRANDENTTISINFLDGAMVSSDKILEMRRHYRAMRMCLHVGETGPPAARDIPKPECFQSTRPQMANDRGASH